MKEWITNKNFAAKRIHIAAISADAGIVVLNDGNRVVVRPKTATALCTIISQEQRRKGCASGRRRQFLSLRK